MADDKDHQLELHSIGAFVLIVHPSWKHDPEIGDYIKWLIQEGKAKESKPISKDDAAKSVSLLLDQARKRREKRGTSD